MLGLLIGTFASFKDRCNRKQTHASSLMRRKRRNSSPDPGIEIVVKNFGRGVAKNVRFERSDKVDDALWSRFLQEIASRTPMSVINKGIPVLPPGVEIPTLWIPGGEIELTCDVFCIICRCQRLGPGPASNVDPVECLLAPLDPVPADATAG